MWKIRVGIFNQRFLSLIAKICVSILILWILFTRIDISDVIEALFKAEITFIAFAILINLAGILLGVYRWQISLAVQEIRVPFIMILKTTLISRFVGLVLPTSVGSDVIRGYDMFKYIKQGVNVFASILFERICGLISLVVIGSCALYFGIQKTGNISLITTFIIVYFVLVLLIIVCFSKVITRRMLSLLGKIRRFNWVKKKLENLSEAIHLYRGCHRAWVSVMSLSIMYQFLGIIFYYTIALSLSLHIPLIVFFILIPIITLVTMTPISPGGLGVKEGMFVLLFNQYGVPPTEALLISLIGTSLYIVFVLIGSIVYITRRRVMSTA